jgi:hypothetical protein
MGLETNACEKFGERFNKKIVIFKKSEKSKIDKKTDEQPYLFVL